MTRYRVYLLDEERHIQGLERFEALTDRQAARQAEAFTWGGPKELWAGPRLVSGAASVRSKAQRPAKPSAFPFVRLPSDTLRT